MTSLPTLLAPATLAVDRDLKIRTWSSSAEAMFGWTPKEALGRTALDLLGGPVEPATLELLARWQPCTFRSTKRHKDGSLVHVRATFEPLHGGIAAGHGLLLLDHGAADAEARYESVVAAMQEGVVVQSAAGEILSCNAAAQRILGLDEDQLCGRTSLDPRWRAVHEDGSAFPGEQHPAMVTLRTGQPLSGVVMGVHKPTGELTWISINTSVVRNADEWQPHAVVATFSDITASKAKDQRLRAQHEQLQFVFEGSNDGFWDWHVPSGRVEFSSRWAAMLGYRLDELEPHVSSWERLVHPDDQDLVGRALQAHLRGETPLYQAEHRVRARDGHWVWILDRGKVVERDARGQAVRVTGTHTDVTLRRAIEERLRGALQDNQQLVTELRAALDNVKVLRGLLPVCAWCKSVRNDEGYWQQIEHYLSEHTQARFTHGLCPACSHRVEST